MGPQGGVAISTIVYCPPFCVSELASEEAYGEAVSESPQDGKHGATSELLRRYGAF